MFWVGLVEISIAADTGVVAINAIATAADEYDNRIEFSRRVDRFALGIRVAVLIVLARELLITILISAEAGWFSDTDSRC